MAGVIVLVLVLVALGGALVVLVETLTNRRRGNQFALLWLMTVAVERLIPLVPAIEAFAWERGGKVGGRARYLAQMLRSGVPLPDAIERVPGLLPRDALPVIRIGCESGAMSAALRQAASAQDVHRPLWLVLAGKLMYLAVLVIFGLGIVTFMMYKIVPSYIWIFDDFELPLPRLTQAVISLSDSFVDWWFLLLLPLLLVSGLRLLCGPARFIKLIRFELPGMTWISRRLDTASILDTLALAAEYHRPMPEAIATLASTYPKLAIRDRLTAVWVDVDEGIDWRESLAAHALLRRADLAILQAAERAGNLPWAMREMADSSRRRLAYRLQSLLQMLYPPCLLVVATAITVFVVAMFIPVVSLLQSLEGL